MIIPREVVATALPLLAIAVAAGLRLALRGNGTPVNTGPLGNDGDSGILCQPIPKIQPLTNGVGPSGQALAARPGCLPGWQPGIAEFFGRAGMTVVEIETGPDALARGMG